MGNLVRSSVLATTSLVFLVIGCAQILGMDADYHEAPAEGGRGGAEPTGGAGGTGGTGGVTSASGQGGLAGAGGDGGTEPGTVSTLPTVADCLEGNGTPASCETEPGALWVDMPNWRAFLRFELDGTLEGKTVTSVTLRLTVGDFTDAESNSTGEVYEVEPFTAGDLLDGPPSQVGGPLVTNRGSAPQLAVIDLSLPSSMVAPNSPVFLGIFPVASDGVGYWNLYGPDPPELLIDYQ